jgi:hypothetical protein
VTERAWRVRLRLRSPFLSQGLGQVRLGVDASFARAPGGDRLTIPGTLLRGLLRHILMDIADETGGTAVDDAAIGRWLGRESDPAGQARDAPWRGLVQVEDLVCDAEPDPEASLTRIAVDRETGSVRAGHLQVIELPFPVGREVEFHGLVRFAGDGADAVAFERTLKLALDLLPAVGAFRSAGFGRVATVSLADETPAPRAPGAAAPFAGWTSALLVLRFLDPFCVNAETPDGNIFLSADEVPGAVIKGALAQRLAADPGWQRDVAPHLHALGIGHAHVTCWDDWVESGVTPAPRPRAAPLSLVAGDKGDPLHDMLAGAPPWMAPPRFQIDWKGKDLERLPEHLRRRELRHEARTRTAVHPEHGGPDPARLFSVHAILPEDDLRWVARLWQGGAPAASFAVLLAHLDGLVLNGIGKTKARAALAVRPEAQLEAAVAYGPDRYALCLETPALLHDLAVLRAAASLEASYACYWAQASQGALALVPGRFFARQRLVGRYLAIRYPPPALRPGWRPPPNPAQTPYEPYLLTEPGSVFLLNAMDTARAPRVVAHWLERGLPLPASLAPTATWENCPFLPAAGYGAVRCARPGEHRSGPA